LRCEESMYIPALHVVVCSGRLFFRATEHYKILAVHLLHSHSLRRRAITVSMSVGLAQGAERKPSMTIPERPVKPGQLYITSKQNHSDQEADGMPPVHGSLSKSDEQANDSR
jgi:hypothetical protein